MTDCELKVGPHKKQTNKQTNKTLYPIRIPTNSSNSS